MKRVLNYAVIVQRSLIDLYVHHIRAILFSHVGTSILYLAASSRLYASMPLRT